MVGIGTVLSLLALVFSFDAPAPVPAAKTEAKTAKKVAVATNTARTRKVRPNTVIDNYKPPVLTAPSGLQVSFPEPTENTIVVADNAELVKLDSYQNPLPSNAKKWDCVTDRTTGLIWEVKTSDHGLQDANHFYSWYSTDSLLNKGDTGSKNNGKCRGGIACDTQAYVQAINARKLCGFSDWRLPTRKELLSLVQGQHNASINTMIDTRFFPKSAGDWYWTSESDADNADYAWYVLFYNGRSMKALKSQAKRIRLVRGGELKRSFRNVAEYPDGITTNEKLARETDSLLPAKKPAATPAS